MENTNQELFIQESNVTEEYGTCCLCNNGLNCDYKFPTIDFFEENGQFAHIKLPILDNQGVPDEILKYIYGSHYDNGAAVKPRHEANIKISLNKLLN